MKSWWMRLFCVGLALYLSGCSYGSQDELQQWMTEQKSQIHPRIKPIAEPKQFKPEVYQPASAAEPFSNQKLVSVLKKEGRQSASNEALLAPELARRKEPLEEFPLDAIALVGGLSQSGKKVALVTVGKLLYQVRLGDHLGQNYGRVMKLTETEISLREIVQDAVGEWVERPAALQLQERTK